jgi:hypothetical protein
MRLPLPRVRTAAWFCAALAVAGCADPPQKELDQAQAAIEVAVSSGAERLDPDGLTAARAALAQARDAVAQRDYKAALSHALDSRERAQAAARAAANAQARARTDTERDLREVTALLAQVQRAVAAAPPSVPRASVRRARAADARLSIALQKTRAAVEAQDYGTAQAALPGLRTELDGLLMEMTGRAPTQSSHRGR